jgi:capsular polysaccharide biosynthesis protein
VERGQPAVQLHEPSAAGGGRTVFQMDQVEILRSQKIGYHVVEKEQLMVKWAIRGPDAAATEQAFQIFRSRLKVQPVPNSGIIEVGCYSLDPVEAADLANSTILVYRDYVTGKLKNWFNDETNSNRDTTISESLNYRVAIVDQAHSPTAPVKPNPLRDILICLGIATPFALGGIYVIVWAQRQQRPTQPPPRSTNWPAADENPY